MPEVTDTKILFFKESIKDFLDELMKNSRKEAGLTTDYACRQAMLKINKEANFQKKLFGII